MTEAEAAELIASVNRRRSDGSVSPVHAPEAHLQLVADFDKLAAAGYQLGADGEFRKATYAEKSLDWINARISEGKTVHIATMTSVTAISPRTAKSWAAKGLTLFKLSPDGLRMASGKRFDLITSTNGPLCRITAQ